MKPFLKIIICFTLVSCQQFSDDKNNQYPSVSKKYFYNYGSRRTHFIFFKYTDQSEGSDDEYMEALTFDIDSNQKGFYATGDKLKKIKCRESFSGGMIEMPRDTARENINKGILYGIKINDTTWNVWAELEHNNEIIAFYRPFVRKTNSIDWLKEK